MYHPVPQLLTHFAQVLTLLLLGARNHPSASLRELGLYAVLDGKTNFVQVQPGPTITWSSATELKEGDYLLCYGPIPTGPMATPADVGTYSDTGRGLSKNKKVPIDSFFSLEPLEPVRGREVTKLQPRTHVKGRYALHYYVGMEGHAYFPFTLN